MPIAKTEPDAVVLGINLRFKRRRYGRQFFTWVHIIEGDGSLTPLPGDPWPCLHPPKEELVRALRVFNGCPASA